MITMDLQGALIIIIKGHLATEYGVVNYVLFLSDNNGL